MKSVKRVFLTPPPYGGGGWGERLLLLLLLVGLVACNSKQTPAVTTEATPVASDSTAAGDTTEVDAITSATSKPNQISFNGTLVLTPQCQATVALTMGGVVRSTSLIPGQHVAKGGILATLENPEFINLQQTYLDSYAQTEYLRAEYDRQKNLSDQQAASQKKFQQSKADYLSMKSRLEASAAQLSLLGVSPESLQKNGIQALLQVHCPISGYISNVSMNVGKYITPGEPLCEVIDKSAPLLKLTAYEKDLENIKVGSAIHFRVNGMGERTFNATLLSIGQKVDEVNRSLEVYARIQDADPQFRPGMYVTARIQR